MFKLQPIETITNRYAAIIGPVIFVVAFLFAVFG